MAERKLASTAKKSKESGENEMTKNIAARYQHGSMAKIIETERHQHRKNAISANENGA